MTTMIAEPEVRDTVRGCHNEQMDCTLSVWKGNEQLAFLDYSVFEQTPHIQQIQTNPAHTRKGYATALLKKLQANFPNREVEWGYVSPDGRALKASITFKKIPTPELEDFQKLDRLNKRLDEMRPGISPQGRTHDEFVRNMTAYNCLDSIVDNLRHRLVFKKMHHEIMTF